MLPYGWWMAWLMDNLQSDASETQQLYSALRRRFAFEGFKNPSIFDETCDETQFEL